MLRNPSDPHFGGLDSHVGLEATAHSATDTITIPDAQLLFGGEYKRAGTDLILSNQDHQFVVHDYFRNGNTPTLLSPDGGRVSADVVEALTGHGDYAQAGAPAQTAATVVGRVVKFDGNATVIRNGVAVSLHVGDGVLKGDVLQTGTGTMAVTFNDGSTLDLAANSRLAVNDFVYDPNRTANSEVLDLVRGSLSFVSGEVAHSGGHMNITTPVATMGIRGTVGTVSNGDDGTVHFSIVESATGAVLLDSKGNIFATITANGPDITVHFQNAQLVAQETQKSPQEIAQQQATLQNILSTQAVGQQILQQFFNQQPNPNPQSTDTQHTQINIDITKTASDNGPPTGPINTGNNPPPQDNTPVVHVVVTDTSNNHVILDEQIQQPLPLPLPTPPAINHAPLIDLTPIITEVPIPSHQLNDGTDPNAVHEVAPAMSHDGRWVVFFSDETNPDSNNNNNNNNPDKGDVLLYDRLTGVTTVLTDATHIPLNERQVGETFSDPSISGDGSTVVFRGEHATGNAPGHGPSSIANIYVYDRASNTTHVLTNPNNGNTPYTVNDPVSIGGGHIVFVSDDFGDNTGPPIRHLYVTDLSGHIQTDIQPGTVGITEPSDPNQSQTEFQQPDISGSGQYLTFWTVAHTFDSIAGTNTQVGPATLYTYDRSNGNYQIIATSSGNDGDNWLASMSGDGRYVVFQSDSNALDVQVGGVANSHMDVFVFDRQANDGLGGIIGITDNASFQANGASERASISDAGNDIIFASLASNLVAGDTNGQGDTFVYDVPSNTFTRVSVASDGAQGNGDSTLGADISGGHFFQGALVTFGSTAGNLVTPNDTDNGQSDIFVVDRTGGIIGSVTEDDTTPAFSGAPLTGFLSTHGAFNFADVDLSDAHTIEVIGDPVITAPSDFVVPQGGLGTFTPTLVDSSGIGHGEVAWTFTVDNANALVQGLNGGERVSEVYTVQIDDGQGGVVTQDVTIVLGGTPDVPEIQGPGSETVDIQLPAGQCSYDRTGDVAFSDPDLTDSHHVQVFFDAAASSSWAQAHFVPTYSNGDTQISSAYGDFQVSLNADSNNGAQGDVNWDLNLNQSQLSAFNSQLPNGTQIAFDVHVIDNFGLNAVHQVIIEADGNHAPVAVDDSNAITAGDAPIAGNVLSNDSDIDQDALSVSDVVNAAAVQDTFSVEGTYGEFVVTKATGAYTYTLGVTTDQANAVSALGQDVQQQDVFTYTASDGLGGTTDANLAITVTGVNDAPFATNGSLSLVPVDDNNANPPGQSIGSLLGPVFSDQDHGDTLAGFAIYAAPQNPGDGTWQWSADGTNNNWQDIPSDASDAPGQLAFVLDTSAFVRFVPNVTFAGAAPDLVGRLIDSSAGAVTDGGRVDLSGHGGGSTPYSSNPVSIGETVNQPADAAPVISDLDPFSDLNLLIVGADNSGFPITELSSFGFHSVNEINATSPITLSELNGYQAVLAFTNFEPDPSVADVLKSYVDEGGGVVVATYGMSEPWAFNSGIMLHGYSPLQPGTNGDVSGQIVPIDPNDPIFDGINPSDITYWYNNNYAHPVLDSGATLIATDGAGVNEIARNQDGSVIAINIFPEEGYQTDPDVFHLFANALDLVGSHAFTNNAAAYTENGPPTVLEPTLKLTDVDNTTLSSATVSISAGFLVGDVLSVGLATDVGGHFAGTNIAGAYDLGSGVLTFNGTDTLAHYQTVLDAVQYSSTSDNPSDFGNDASRTISWVINDGTLNSSAETSTVTVNAVNDAPTVDLDTSHPGTGYENAIAADGNPGAVFGDQVSVSDVDNATIHSASVTLQGGGEFTDYPNEDVAIDLTGLSGATGDGHNGSWDGVSWGITNGSSGFFMTATGDASGATYEQLLEAVRFTSTSNDHTDHTAHVTVNDGIADSNVATATIHIEAPPAIDADNAIPTPVPNTDSARLAGLVISDADAGSDPLTITATADHGTLAPPPESTSGISVLDNGTDGTLSGSGTLDAINAMLAVGVTYTPTLTNPNDSNSLPANDKIAVTIDDGHGGTDAVNFIFNVAGAGPDITLQGTSGKDVLFATGFTDTLTGNASSDTFVFGASQHGSDAITDFNTHQDFLKFGAGIFNSIDDVISTATGNAQSTVVHAAGDEITLQGVSLTQFQQIDHGHILLA